jgi:import inner membrane translocase subunit TIM50
VLLITADEHAGELQPENTVKIKAWKMESGDHVLLDLIPFLEAIFRTNVPDVRTVVKAYEGEDIPSAFRERMRKVQEQRQQTKPKRRLFGL